MTFPSILGDYIESHLTGVRVALPGRVVKYYAETQRADVQVEIQDGELDEDEQRKAVTLPIVADVPVVFPGAGGWRFTFPIAVGDGVLVVFASSSIARWKAAGGGIVDPADDRRHHLADAIAIPGLSAGAPTEAPTDAMVFHAEKLKLGGPGATDRVARQSDLEALKAKIVAAPDGLAFGTTLKLSLDAPGDAWPNCTSKVTAE